MFLNFCFGKRIKLIAFFDLAARKFNHYIVPKDPIEHCPFEGCGTPSLDLRIETWCEVAIYAIVALDKLFDPYLFFRPEIYFQ